MERKVILQTSEQCIYYIKDTSLEFYLIIPNNKEVSIVLGLFPEVNEGIVKTLPFEKDKAIEFNTSRILRKDAPVLPDREIFTRYKELGGTRITLGADAHNTESLASGIKEALDLLRDIGFTEYTVYIDRKSIQVPIIYIPDEGEE